MRRRLDLPHFLRIPTSLQSHDRDAHLKPRGKSSCAASSIAEPTGMNSKLGLHQVWTMHSAVGHVKLPLVKACQHIAGLGWKSQGPWLGTMGGTNTLDLPGQFVRYAQYERTVRMTILRGQDSPPICL